MSRYKVTEVSVGNAGLTSRPSVYDTKTQQTIKVYRQSERHLAEALAVELNAKEGESR